MEEHEINWILKEMQPLLSPAQLKELKRSMLSIPQQTQKSINDQQLLNLFLTAKKIEGCSGKTVAYYKATIEAMSFSINKSYTHMSTEDLRQYLNNYERQRKTSKVTIDNIRRILSSFFVWLEDEDYIVKSPVRRIHHVKTPQRIKGIITDEELERIRGACSCKRDLAIINILASTGMRVGELVNLDINDVNLLERECTVIGKGNKQRVVFFDARTKISLEEYLETRIDGCPALFVSLSKASRRLSISGIERRLKTISQHAHVREVHPHKFRRTLATNAIDKGMPIEQVQSMLGHEKIETTMRYAMVQQSNVKASHRKYLG